ncbi:50S ribosomal protein L6 [Candidatus Woesearchaeota archaeon]|nr:MAG: 50S ribosomal protein L6 [Candidatus Woesearchaeota archaeon]
MKADINLEAEIPEGVTVDITGNGKISVKGPKGKVFRQIKDAKIKFQAKDNKVLLFVKGATKREKSLINTYFKHIQNMMKGVVEGFVYKLKICSGHFPMNVAVSGNKLTVKNFIGEKFPRVLTIKDAVDVKVDGDIITVESIDKEKAGQVAADIENMMRVTNRDRRIFQDGIYIIEKAGKTI